MKAFLIPMTAVCFVGLAARAAEPAAPQPPPGVHQACLSDLNKLCADVQSGHGRRRACLEQHESELSPGCRKAMQTANAHHATAKPGTPEPAPSKSQ